MRFIRARFVCYTMNRINIRPRHMRSAQVVGVSVPSAILLVSRQGLQQMRKIRPRIRIANPKQGLGCFLFGGGCSGRPEVFLTVQVMQPPHHPRPRKSAASASPGLPPHNPPLRWHGHNPADNSATHACRTSTLRASELSSGQSVCRCPQRLRPIVDHPPWRGVQARDRGSNSDRRLPASR